MILPLQTLQHHKSAAVRKTTRDNTAASSSAVAASVAESLAVAGVVKSLTIAGTNMTDVVHAKSVTMTRGGGTTNTIDSRSSISPIAQRSNSSTQRNNVVTRFPALRIMDDADDVSCHGVSGRNKSRTTKGHGVKKKNDLRSLLPSPELKELKQKCSCKQKTLVQEPREERVGLGWFVTIQSWR